MLAGTSPGRNKGGEGGITGCTGWSQQNHMGTGEKERKFLDLFKRIFQVKLGRIKSFDSKRLNVVAHYLPRQKIAESPVQPLQSGAKCGDRAWLLGAELWKAPGTQP